MTKRVCLIPLCGREPKPEHALCFKHTDDALRDLAGGPLIRAVATFERVSDRIAAMHPAGRPGRG